VKSRLDTPQNAPGTVPSLTRRDALALACVGVGGALLSAWSGTARAQEAPAGCVVRPEQTEGPYFVDGRLDRSDIRSDPAGGSTKPGSPLALTFVVSALTRDACAPLPGARVDLWQCDAEGVYSGVDDPSFDTRGALFLRGAQKTDSRGRAGFVTLYPGAYPGRAVHVHFKVRAKNAAGRELEFTSQLYFDDALTDRVHSLAPYTRRRRTPNSGDGIFVRDGGSRLLLPVSTQRDGYAGTFELALQL